MNPSPEDGRLIWCAQRALIPEMQALLAQGASPCAANPEGRTALHMAALGGHVAVIRLLADSNAPLDAPEVTQQRWTPLHLASERNDEGCVRALLLYGAHPNALGGRGETPLHRALIRGHLKTVQALVEGGASLSCQSELQGSALHIASYYGHLNVIMYLLEQGADPRQPDWSGARPDRYAAYKHPECADLLAAAAAYADLQDCETITPQ